jgi:hypothetical protein
MLCVRILAILPFVSADALQLRAVLLHVLQLRLLSLALTVRVAHLLRIRAAYVSTRQQISLAFSVPITSLLTALLQP